MTVVQLEAAPVASTQDGSFASKLAEPRERFLAAVVQHALVVGRRKATDFLRSFSAREIMNALREQPALRAKILSETTGLNTKIAVKKSAETSGEDLEIALAEKVTNEDAIVSLFDPDDRVRYLPHHRLWNFVVEGAFWKATQGTVSSIAREHVAYILSCARAEKLLSDRDLVDGIGLDTLVASFPKKDVVCLLERALTDGRSTRAFTDESVLDVLPPARLLEHVNLAHIWERVIATKLSFDAPPEGAAKTTTDPEAAVPAPSASVPVVAPERGASGRPSPSPHEALLGGAAIEAPAPTSSSVGLYVTLDDDGEPLVIAEDPDVQEEPTANNRFDVTQEALGGAESVTKLKADQPSTRPGARSSRGR